MNFSILPEVSLLNNCPQRKYEENKAQVKYLLLLKLRLRAIGLNGMYLITSRIWRMNICKENKISNILHNYLHTCHI